MTLTYCCICCANTVGSLLSVRLGVIKSVLYCIYCCKCHQYHSSLNSRKIINSSFLKIDFVNNFILVETFMNNELSNESQPNSAEYSSWRTRQCSVDSRLKFDRDTISCYKILTDIGQILVMCAVKPGMVTVLNENFARWRLMNWIHE